MIGDADNMRQRIRLTLPVRWFADDAPVLEALLAGLATSWSQLFLFLGLVKLQTRLATSTGEFLDLISKDFFGARLARRAIEPDEPFRARLQRAMRRTRATRGSLADAAREVGFDVALFEAARPADTGAYNVAAGLAWNTKGGWGSLQMPLECLVQAARTTGALDGELLPALAESLPAGGVAWVRIIV